MQKGLSPNATTRLPLGNPLHGYAIALEIEIIDALGAGTLDILVVMVILTSFISKSGISIFPIKCRTIFSARITQLTNRLFERGRGGNFSEREFFFRIFLLRFALCVFYVARFARFSLVAFSCAGICFGLLSNPSPVNHKMVYPLL